MLLRDPTPFQLFVFKNIIRLGAFEHYSPTLQKHHKLYMITVQSCWTKAFDNSLLNSAQVKILGSLGSPVCGWPCIPKLAEYDCLAQFFTSLMHMNCSQAPLSMLMSILVCYGTSHCLLIKLILVEDGGNTTPKGQRGEEDGASVVFLSQRVRFHPSHFSLCLLNWNRWLKTDLLRFSLALRLDFE